MHYSQKVAHKVTAAFKDIVSCLTKSPKMSQIITLNAERIQTMTVHMQHLIS